MATNLKKYVFRCLAYQERDRSIAVCLDLDIVEEGKTLKEVVNNLNEAITGHLEVAAKYNFPSELTFRPAPKKYWRKYENFLIESLKSTEQPRPSLSPVQILNQPYLNGQPLYA